NQRQFHHRMRLFSSLLCTTFHQVNKLNSYCTKSHKFVGCSYLGYAQIVIELREQRCRDYEQYAVKVITRRILWRKVYVWRIGDRDWSGSGSVVPDYPIRVI